MVPREQLLEMFHYEDGKIYGKHVDWRRKEVNSRVCGKELGTPFKGGYKQINFHTRDGTKVRALVHRVIWAMHNDCWPDLLDHIDRDPTNNRVENLRVANKSQNSRNSGTPLNNTSGVKGVYLDKLGGYVAYIKPNKHVKRLSLGRYKTLEEAKAVRQEAERVYWDDLRGNEGLTS